MKKYLFFKNSAFPRIPRPDSPLPFGIFPRISTGTVTPPPPTASPPTKNAAFPRQNSAAPFSSPGTSRLQREAFPISTHQNFSKIFRSRRELLTLSCACVFSKVFQSQRETLSRSILPKSSFEDLKRQRDIHGFAKTGVRQLLRRVFPCGALLSNPPQPAGGFLRRVHNPP